MPSLSHYPKQRDQQLLVDDAVFVLIFVIKNDPVEDAIHDADDQRTEQRPTQAIHFKGGYAAHEHQEQPVQNEVEDAQRHHNERDGQDWSRSGARTHSPTQRPTPQTPSLLFRPRHECPATTKMPPQ
jgi:hypothetical protein